MIHLLMTGDCGYFFVNFVNYVVMAQGSFIVTNLDIQSSFVAVSLPFVSFWSCPSPRSNSLSVL